MNKTHTLKHYKILADGTLRLVRTERVADAPRTELDFGFLAARDTHETAALAQACECFEALVDAACEA